MPNTLVTIRYGTPAALGDPRPSVVRMGYPTWTLAAEPRVRMPYRMQVTPAVVGNYIAPLTEDPMVMELDMALRQRRGINRVNVGNPVAAIVALRQLQGQPLMLQWGAEIDWGDEWYLTGVDLGFRLPAQYPADIGGTDSRDGGLVFDTVGVRMSFTANIPSLTAPILFRPLDIATALPF